LQGREEQKSLDVWRNLWREFGGEKKETETGWSTEEHLSTSITFASVPSHTVSNLLAAIEMKS
jgi:hypothetical protein